MLIIPPGVSDLYRKVTEAGNIRDAIDISNFLNLAEEAKEEEDRHTVGDEDVLQEVIQEHLSLQSTKDDEEDDEQLAQLVYLVFDTSKALHVLIRFTEGQESLSTDFLRVLERMESAIDGIRQASLVQGTLDSWIT